MFNKIALAVALSPSGKSLIGQAVKIKSYFSSELFLIHAGEKKSSNEDAIAELIASTGLSEEEYTLIWKTSDTVKSILKVCDEKNIDLLIFGALESEPGFKYLVGSVARKLMRKLPCSLLIRKAPVTDIKKYKTIAVQTNLSSESEQIIKKAYEFAMKEEAEKFILIRELKVPGLTMTVYDSGSPKETQNLRQQWIDEELIKMELFINDLNLKGVNVEHICLYGKEGWESSKYLKSISADLYILASPNRKYAILDRVFQHGLEFLYEDLPCDLLILQS